MICGDLDSLLPEVEEHYRTLGALIIKEEEQDSTDFTKCLRHIDRLASGLLKDSSRINPTLLTERLDVAVFGGLGGRADQAFSQLHNLYAASRDIWPGQLGDLYLVTMESIVFCLQRGHNTIYTPVRSRIPGSVGSGLLGESVGIIPVAQPSVISTTGLEWDVKSWPTEFGKQISTSNHIKSDIVSVQTTERVLFTVEITKESVQPTKENHWIEF